MVSRQSAFEGRDSVKADLSVMEEVVFEGKAAVYDIESDRNSDAVDRKALPRRVRFYQGKLP